MQKTVWFPRYLTLLLRRKSPTYAVGFWSIWRYISHSKLVNYHHSDFYSLSTYRTFFGLNQNGIQGPLAALSPEAIKMENEALSWSMVAVLSAVPLHTLHSFWATFLVPVFRNHIPEKEDLRGRLP